MFDAGDIYSIVVSSISIIISIIALIKVRRSEKRLKKLIRGLHNID
jgi:hypothetical protein